MTAGQTVLSEVRGSVAWLTLNRPDALNAINGVMLDELAGRIDEIESEDAVRAVVLTGSGTKAFSAGADIAVLNAAVPDEVRGLALKAVSVGLRIEQSAKVYVAAVNGFALGGGLELAEACDIRLAADHARFGHPEVKIGAVAGWGGTARLCRIIGAGRAAELLLTGRVIDAGEAHAIGLVHLVVPGAELTEHVQNMTSALEANAPYAVHLTKEALRKGLDRPIEEALRIGADAFGRIAHTADFREGTKAFIEKRSPGYRGA